MLYLLLNTTVWQNHGLLTAGIGSHAVSMIRFIREYVFQSVGQNIFIPYCMFSFVLGTDYGEIVDIKSLPGGEDYQ